MSEKLFYIDCDFRKIFFKKEGSRENDKTVTMWKKCYTNVLQKQTFLLKLGTR